MPTLNDLVAVESDLKRAESEIARLTAELDKTHTELKIVRQTTYARIDSLTDERDRLNDLLETAGKQYINRNADCLRAERERDRLREVLTQIEQQRSILPIEVHYICNIAKRALEQSMREQKP